MTAAMIPRLANTASSRDVVDALTEMGAVIVERLVSEELIDNVMAELTPFIDATPYGSDSFSGRTTRRTGSLLARSMLSHELIGHLLILDAAKQYLWGQKETFQLHLTQAITIEPGGPAQLMHRDQWCFDHFPFPDDVNVEMSTIWAMCDFTEDIGATRVIPGSHREAEHTVACRDQNIFGHGSKVDDRIAIVNHRPPAPPFFLHRLGTRRLEINFSTSF